MNGRSLRLLCLPILLLVAAPALAEVVTLNGKQLTLTGVKRSGGPDDRVGVLASAASITVNNTAVALQVGGNVAWNARLRALSSVTLAGNTTLTVGGGVYSFKAGTRLELHLAVAGPLAVQGGCLVAGMELTVNGTPLRIKAAGGSAVDIQFDKQGAPAMAIVDGAQTIQAGALACALRPGSRITFEGGKANLVVLAANMAVRVGSHALTALGGASATTSLSFDQAGRIVGVVPAVAPTLSTGGQAITFRALAPLVFNANGTVLRGTCGKAARLVVGAKPVNVRDGHALFFDTNGKLVSIR